MLGIAAVLPDLDLLWRRTAGLPEVCIAVLDGPVDLTHPCLTGASLQCVDFLATGGCWTIPRSSHGTHVSSIIFGQPASGFQGISPGCSGIIIPIYKESVEGELLSCTQADLAKALAIAVEMGASVINVSGGELSANGELELCLREAIAAAAKEALIVAAAGNDGCACLHVPAAAPDVLAIGALSKSGQPLTRSNWGENYRQNGLLVPGDDIGVADPGGGYSSRTSTSSATAVASGIAALLCCLQLQHQGSIKTSLIREALLSSAKPCTGSEELQRCLAGKLDIEGAYRRLFSTNGGQRMAIEENRKEVITPLQETHDAPSAGVVQAGITASECSCGGQARQEPTRVFAIGTLGYDFGSEARRNSFMQAINVTSPPTAAELLVHFTSQPHAAAAIVWTLNLDTIPIYAIAPHGPFGADVYMRLREILTEQGKEGLWVSLAGITAGKARLMSGQEVTAVFPDLRGLYSWSTDALLSAFKKPDNPAVRDQVHNFLERIYSELRNPGVRPQDRARNFAATNAYQVHRIFQDAIRDKLELDEIGVERSPYCHPESDCWDVKLAFFDPVRRLERARKVYRFTVDVSDTVPTTIGSVRSWSIY